MSTPAPTAFEEPSTLPIAGILFAVFIIVIIIGTAGLNLADIQMKHAELLKHQKLDMERMKLAKEREALDKKDLEKAKPGEMEELIGTTNKNFKKGA